MICYCVCFQPWIKCDLNNAVMPRVAWLTNGIFATVLPNIIWQGILWLWREVVYFYSNVMAFCTLNVNIHICSCNVFPLINHRYRLQGFLLLFYQFYFVLKCNLGRASLVNKSFLFIINKVCKISNNQGMHISIEGCGILINGFSFLFSFFF